MGARGPKKKLAVIEALEGNPSKRAIEDMGVAALGAPFIPDHLADDAQGCIDLITQSMPPKVYALVDTFLLAAFGVAWAIHKRAAHELAQPGFQFIVANAAGNEVQNTWIKVHTQQAMLMATLGDRLGLNPKARAQIKLPEPGKQASKFDGLLGHSG